MILLVRFFRLVVDLSTSTPMKHSNFVDFNNSCGPGRDFQGLPWDTNLIGSSIELAVGRLSSNL